MKSTPIIRVALSGRKLFVAAGCLMAMLVDSLAFQPICNGRVSKVFDRPTLFLPSVDDFNARRGSSRLFFFGNKEADTKEKELAFFPKLATSNTDVKFESLVGFITTWSQKFEDDRKGMGLSTPVKIKASLEELGESDGNIVEEGGVQILFKATKTGDTYKNKKEEDAEEEGAREAKKKKKKGPPKEGGVEIRVEKLANGEVQLRARRCEVDEDTTIKEMSEEAILSELKAAVDAWKKQ